MTKHSPWPWRMSVDDAVRDRDGNMVCRRPPAVFDDEWSADARLIAAAPELLAMAKHLIAVAFGGFGPTDEPLDQEARALIAHIEGEPRNTTTTDADK